MHDDAFIIIRSIISQCTYLFSSSVSRTANMLTVDGLVMGFRFAFS